MTIQRMDYVGIVVDDLAAAAEFFVELGLELQGEGSVEVRWVDRIVRLEGVRTRFAMMQTPVGRGRVELVKFHSPSHQGDRPVAAAVRHSGRATVEAALRSFFAPRSRTDGTVRMGVVFRCYLAERAR